MYIFAGLLAHNSPVNQNVRPPFRTGLPPYIVLVLPGQYKYNVVVLPPGAAGTMYLQCPPTGGQCGYIVVVLPGVV